MIFLSDIPSSSSNVRALATVKFPRHSPFRSHVTICLLIATRPCCGLTRLGTFLPRKRTSCSNRQSRVRFVFEVVCPSDDVFMIATPGYTHCTPAITGRARVRHRFIVRDIELYGGEQLEIARFSSRLANLFQYTNVGCLVIDNIAPILGPNLSAVTAEGSECRNPAVDPKLTCRRV